MRHPSAWKWPLVCLSTILFVCLVLLLLVSVAWLLRLNPPGRPLPSDIRGVFEMDVYYEKGPFVLMVGKDFPRNESFVLAQRSGEFLVSSTDRAFWGGDAGTREVSVGLRDDFSVSVEYSPSTANGCQLHCLQLTRGNETFFDEKGDGSFDVRHVRDTERNTSQVYVFYQGDWREVKEFISKYHRKLVGGQEVTFDMQTGKWVPREEGKRDAPKAPAKKGME